MRRFSKKSAAKPAPARMERIGNPPFMRKAHSEALRSVLGSPVRSSHRGFAQGSREAQCKRYTLSGDTTPQSKPTVLPAPLTQGSREARCKRYPRSPIQPLSQNLRFCQLPLHRGAEKRSANPRCEPCTGEAEGSPPVSRRRSEKAQPPSPQSGKIFFLKPSAEKGVDFLQK